MFITAADGSGAPTIVTRRKNVVYSVAFRPDCAALALSEYDPQTLFAIWLVPLNGGDATPLFRAPGSEWQPVFSPDGRSMAYLWRQNTPEDVHVQALDGRGKWRVFSGGFHSPVWSRDGRELHFVAGNEILVASIAPGDDPRPGAPRRILPTLGPSLNSINRAFDLSADGRSLALVKPAARHPVRRHRELAALNQVTDYATRADCRTTTCRFNRPVLMDGLASP